MRGWQCENCGRRVVVARRRCQFCGSGGGVTIEIDEHGTLVSWTVPHIGASAPIVVARVLDQLVPAVLTDGLADELTPGIALRLAEGQNGGLEASLAEPVRRQ
jgi:hypothetical protein